MATIIQVPTRRRGNAQSMFTPEQLAKFAEAVPQLAPNEAVLVADADSENEARYAARIAQQELRNTYDINSRTNVFKHQGRWCAALRRKHGQSHAQLPETGQPATPVPAPAQQQERQPVATLPTA